MALTTERIKELWDAYRAALPRYLGFAKAIEAEVRKQDEALIRMLVERLERATRVMTISEDEAPGYFAVIAAARARLEEKPCAYRTTQL